MNFKISYKEDFLKDIETHKKSGQTKLLSKISGFVSEIRMDPRSGTGKPEHLKFMQVETWSRRINAKHRLIYEINGDKVSLLSAWGHYDDK